MSRLASQSNAGYILAGGRSSRMGLDKAVLPHHGSTLVEFVAETVCAAAGSATLVGHAPVGHLRAIPDLHPDFGPLGGIVTALYDTPAEWNLIVACDMPRLEVEPLRGLLDMIQRTGADAVVPRTADERVHPLCAAYRKRALEALQRSVEEGIHTVRKALDRLNTMYFYAGSGDWLTNVNTPEQWASVMRQG